MITQRLETLAFWLLAGARVPVALTVVPREERSWVDVLRVAAFVVIAIAIARKNSNREGYVGGTRPRRGSAKRLKPRPRE